MKIKKEINKERRTERKVERKKSYKFILSTALLHDTIQYQIHQFKIHMKFLLPASNIKFKILTNNTAATKHSLVFETYMQNVRRCPCFHNTFPFHSHYHYHYCDNGYWIIHRTKVGVVWC